VDRLALADPDRPSYLAVLSVLEDPAHPAVPAIVDAALQERAQITLTENKRYPRRKNDRKYLLSGLVMCAVCGSLCSGHPTTRKGKKYFYYTCRASRTNNFGAGRPHKASYVTASWLEEMVWADVRQFLEDPGEVLERVREQLGADDATDELESRQEELGRRLATKQAEKDRYVHLYAQRHISDEELETYLLDLRNQMENLRLLLGSVEAELSQKRAHQGLTKAAHAWLVTLRERIADVEEDTAEAFRVRRQLVKLLVQSITAGKKHEGGSIEVRITYRFGPPGGVSEGSTSSDSQDILAGDYSFVGSLMNGNLS
jgi:site-specific DNA recombinase